MTGDLDQMTRAVRSCGYDFARAFGDRFGSGMLLRIIFLQLRFEISACLRWNRTAIAVLHN